MGVFELYDCLSGNPIKVDIVGINKAEAIKKYYWQNIVRLIKKDGSVTDIGHYDGYGNVIINDEKFKGFSPDLCADEIEHDGIVIIDRVYEILINDVEFKSFMKGKNLYQELVKWSWKHGLGRMHDYMDSQEFVIISKDFDEEFKRHTEGSYCSESSKDIYMFIDPKVSEDNKERIEEHVSLFTDNYY